jgi:hypothetical protein
MILSSGQITATVRPNFPWRIQHTNTRDNRQIWKVDRPVPMSYEIPMDWHHIIPWRVLRNGWSALATSGRWEVLTAWAELWNLSNVPGIVNSMQNGNLGHPNNENMFNKLCWAEWNLVEGPTNGNRAPGDDPGSDGLDSFEGIGMPNNVRNRSLILKSIYTQMRNWEMNTANITASQAKLLLQDFKKLSPYKRSPISMFDPKVWVLVEQGRINKFGLADKHPTWKKCSR